MKALFAALVLALVAGKATAQALSDPMRPPNAAAESSNPGAPAGPSLQSILFASNRWYAVIDGQQVRIGEKFRDATLVNLTVSEATLRSGGSTTILKLYPEAQKAPGRSGIRLIPTGTEEGNRK
jgi:opacity protein-like surface antigen